jgi:hypothetical protein
MLIWTFLLVLVCGTLAQSLSTIFALYIFVYKLPPFKERNPEKGSYMISAGYSEDSDYTSDLNYPVGQHANSSASQFRSAAHQMCTPQRSLETSRENSYERDDVPQGQGHYYGGSGDTGRRYSDNESEPLFYNSRPKNYKEYNRCVPYPYEHYISQSLNMYSSALFRCLHIFARCA